MFIVSKRNVLFRSGDGELNHGVVAGYMGIVPDWVADTDLFKDMVSDGLIVVTKSARDKDVTAAVEAAETKSRRSKKAE